MKRNFSMLLCLLLVFSMLLVSCGKNPAANDTDKEKGTTGACEHTFSADWASNATHHWHRATCEHGEIKDALAEHADANEDGLCDVCKYEIGHNHTYSDEWTSDETKHWKAATCSHTDEKLDEGLHADDDKNYECDVCKAHVHQLNDAGYCAGCDKQIIPVDLSKPDALINAILASSGKINGGTIAYDVIIRGLENDITVGHGVDFSLYTDGLYTKRTNGTLVNEVWKKLNGQDVIAISVEKDGSTVTKAEPAAADVESLLGYYFAVSTLADGYGAENILSTLYELSLLETATEVTFSVDQEKKTAKLSYNVLIINKDTAEGEDDGVNYYEVDVTFGYSDTFALTSLTIKCDCYTNSLENEAENDYTYDQATQKITMKDTAKADTYTFVVTQTEGARGAIEMPATDKYTPSDLTIYEDEEMTTVAESVTVQITDAVLDLYIGIPEGTFIGFIANDIKINIANKDANGAAMIGWLSGDKIEATLVAEGEYTMTITCGSITKTIEIKVEAPSSSLGENTFEIVGDDNNAWVGPYNFVAPESGTYSFFLPYGVGAWDADGFENGGFTSAPYVDPMDPFYSGSGSFTVEIAQGATYSFYFNVPAKNVPYTVSYNFVAHDVEVDVGGDEPSVNEFSLNIGNNNIDPKNAIYSFTAGSDGELSLSLGAAIMGDVTVTYSVNGGDEIAFALSSNITLTLNAGDKVVITVVSEGYSTLGASWSGGAAPQEPTDVVLGTYTGTDNWNASPLTVIIGEGTVTFDYNHPMMGSQTATYTYEVIDGAMVIYDETGAILNPLAGSVTLVDGVPTMAAYNGTNYNLAVAGSGEGGDDEGDDPVVEGSDENPIEITIPAENLETEGDAVGFIWYTFTTTEAGKITVAYSNTNSWVRLINVDDAEDSTTGYQKGILTFKVKANSTYKIGLGVWDPEEGVTASVTFEVVEESPLDNKGDFYCMDEKTFGVTDADILAGGFIAIFNSADAGEYNFVSNYLMISSIATEDGTVISKNDNWFYELEAYTAYTVTFSTEYVSVAGDYSVVAEYQYPEGHQENPFWLPWDYEYGNALTAVYKGLYSPVWYSFYADADGVITITSDNEVATLMIAGKIGYEVQGVGSVSLNVIKGRQYYIGIADFETVDENWVNVGSEINFVINFTEAEYVGDGTINMPNMIVPGENTAVVPAWGCVWFAYKAEANGTLSVTTENEVCAWYFDGQEDFATAGDKVIKVEEGMIVYLYIETSDWSAAEIIFTASFKADPASVWFEDVVITDGSAANQVNVADNTWVEISFQGAGQFTITWDNADAKVEIPESWASAGQVLANGDVITGDSWFGVTLMISFEDYAAGTVNVTITPYVAPVGDKVLAVGDNTVSVQDTMMGDAYALPVNADKDVTYVITVGANCVVIYDYTNFFEGQTLELTVPAGETVVINIGAYSWSDNVAYVTVAEKVQQEVQEGEATAETITFVVPTIASMLANSEVQTVSVGASGSYVISATGYDNILNTRLQYYSAATDSWVTIARAIGHADHQIPYVIELSAGDTLQLRVQTWNSADAGTEIVVTIAPQA